jgi:hypothetical protein
MIILRLATLEARTGGRTLLTLGSHYGCPTSKFAVAPPALYALDSRMQPNIESYQRCILSQFIIYLTPYKKGRQREASGVQGAAMSPRSPARGRRSLARMVLRAATLLAVRNTVASRGRLAHRSAGPTGKIAHAPHRSQRAVPDPESENQLPSPNPFPLPCQLPPSTPPIHDARFVATLVESSFLTHSLSSAPSGGLPVSRYCHNATNNFRAKATIPILR